LTLIIATPKGEVVDLVQPVNNVKYMDKYRENIFNGNAVYIYGVFDESIIILLPEIKKEIDNQKTLKNGKIIFHINSNGGQFKILQSLLNLVEYAKKENIIVETIVECNAFSCAS
jgi:ATP-dependent protease ClpP protease subunit